MNLIKLSNCYLAISCSWLYLLELSASTQIVSGPLLIVCCKWGKTKIGFLPFSPTDNSRPTTDIAHSRSMGVINKYSYLLGLAI